MRGLQSQEINKDEDRSFNRNKWIIKSPFLTALTYSLNVILIHQQKHYLLLAHCGTFPFTGGSY